MTKSEYDRVLSAMRLMAGWGFNKAVEATISYRRTGEKFDEESYQKRKYEHSEELLRTILKPSELPESTEDDI